MMSNQCIGCGAEMPEGNQICPACIKNAKNGMLINARAELEQASKSIKNALMMLAMLERKST